MTPEREKEIREYQTKMEYCSSHFLRELLAEIDKLREENKKQSYVIDMGRNDLINIRALLGMNLDLQKRVEELERRHS